MQYSSIRLHTPRIRVTGVKTLRAGGSRDRIRVRRASWQVKRSLRLRKGAFCWRLLVRLRFIGRDAFLRLKSHRRMQDRYRTRRTVSELG